MRNRSKMVLASALLAVAAVACGDGAEDATTTTQAEATETTEAQEATTTTSAEVTSTTEAEMTELARSRAAADGMRRLLATAGLSKERS